MFIVFKNNINNYVVNIFFYRRVEDHHLKLINLNKQLGSELTKKELDE